jgi:hypothetical protein
MAKGGTIEIDVELQGTQNIETQFKNIGDASKNLASTMGNTNEKLGEGIDAIGESFTGVRDSIGELGAGISNLGKGGAMSFLGLLGPIAGVTTALFTAYETFKLISGAAQEAEENEQAMAAAASDLQSKLEALAEKGVIPTTKQLEKFTLATIKSQFAKEKLQSAQEKLTKKVQAAFEANAALAEAQQRLTKAESQGLLNARELITSRAQLVTTTHQAAEATRVLRKSADALLKKNIEVEKSIKDAAKQEKELEETSAEALKGKIKENAEKLKGLVLSDLETRTSEKQFKLTSLQIEEDTKLALLKAEKNKENREALMKQNEELEHALKLIDEERIIRRRSTFETQKVLNEINEKNKAAREKEAAERKRSADQRKAMDQLRLQQEKIKIAELAKIRQLEIQAQEDSVQKQIQLITHQYNTSLKLAGDNQRQQQMAVLTYYNQLNAITQKEEAKKTRIEQQEAQRRQEFALSTREFNIQQIENDLQRETEMLTFKYQQQFEQAKGNQEQITELQRRYGIERMNLILSESKEAMKAVNGFFGQMGRGFAEAAVGALFFGESFKESVGALLMALSQQAAVEALMNTAKGFAALSNPLTAAAAPGFFKAAGIFASAATVAGVTGSAMGGGGGGISVGGGGGVSPSGSPQSVGQAPQREEATASTQVFNINFSGAVVYDTKRAAEEAFADRIMRTMSRNRRGSRRMS